MLAKVMEAFMNYKALEKNESDCEIEILRTNNSPEYCGPEFTKQELK